MVPESARDADYRYPGGGPDEQGAKPAEVALAWLIGREGVIRADRQRHQRGSGGEFCRAAALSLSAEQVARLDGASAEAIPLPGGRGEG